MNALRTVGLVLGLAVVACGGSAPPQAPVEKKPSASGSDFEHFFPLEDGRIYHYVTNDGGEKGMLVAKVSRTDATHGELRMSNATKRFVYSTEGVAYDNGLFVIKGPLAVGTSWRGEHGGTAKIVATDAKVTVPAGSYASCVVTLEEDGRPPGAKYSSTYCPGVGMVILDVSLADAKARAELKSYGAPVLLDAH